MREIWLLRHGQAEPATLFGGSDFERPLSARGQQQARAAAAWLQAQAPQPDIILCSPTRRTCMTAAPVSAALGPKEVPIRFVDTIHDATPGDLLALLERHHEHACALLIGHNPGLERLVTVLCPDDTAGFAGMATGMLAHVRLHAGLQPDGGRLLGVHAF